VKKELKEKIEIKIEIEIGIKIGIEVGRKIDLILFFQGVRVDSLEFEDLIS